VQRRIRDRGNVVVVPQRRSEGHAGVEQRTVRPGELLVEIVRTLRAVEVIAHHQHQLERKRPVGQGHLSGHVELRLFAGAVVADYRQLQRTGVIRQRRRRLSSRNRHQTREQDSGRCASHHGSPGRHERGTPRVYRDAGFQSGQVRHSADVSTLMWGASTGWWHTQNTSSTRDSSEVSCSTAAPNRPHSQVHGT
jgi:hypothetical protein